MTSTQDVFISGTEGDPVSRARTELDERAGELTAELSDKVATAAVLEHDTYHRQQARNRLAAFCYERVLPYLDALDRAVYAVAAGASETRLLVRGLRAQRPLVVSAVADLERATDIADIGAAGHTVLALLDASRAVEREVLWPALGALPGVDLPTVVADLDTVLAGGTLDVPAELDVREIPHGRRHPTIFGTYARLSPGGSFVIVNNHDPKPLRREFEATFPGAFAWDYVESGPERWRVRIGKVATPSPGAERE